MGIFLVIPFLNLINLHRLLANTECSNSPTPIAFSPAFFSNLIEYIVHICKITLHSENLHLTMFSGKDSPCGLFPLESSFIHMLYLPFNICLQLKGRLGFFCPYSEKMMIQFHCTYASFVPKQHLLS